MISKFKEKKRKKETILDIWDCICNTTYSNKMWLCLLWNDLFFFKKKEFISKL